MRRPTFDSFLAANRDNVHSPLSQKKVPAPILFKIATAFTIATIILTTQSRAFAAPTSQLVDSFVVHEASAGKIPGISIAVVRGGAIVYTKGYGFADNAKSIKATPQTIYPIASLSKQFTAAIIMQLVQDGKLKLDSPINPLLLRLNPPAAWKAITVRELLNQTSGIADYLALVDITKGQSTTPKSLVDLLRTTPLAFTPGTSFKYSNSNYFLLAEIAENVTGEDIYSLLNSRLFQPLGLTDTGLYNYKIKSHERATGYVLESNHITTNFPKVDTEFSIGCGGIQTTVLDLAKWDAALYRNSPLTAKSKQAMWTPSTVSDGYGFGWVVDSANGHKLIWHNGAIPGYSSWMGRFVDDKLTVIVLCNQFDADDYNVTTAKLAEIGQGIAGLYVPSLIPLSIAPTAAKSGVDPKLLAICKKAITDVYSGNANPAMYTPDTAQALFPGAINQTGQLFRSLGPLQSFEPLSVKKEGGVNEITCRVKFGSTTLVYMFVLTQGANLIAGIIPQH